MTHPARQLSDEEIDSLAASQALNELFQREHRSREDRVSIWIVSLGMVMFFLILVLFMIQVVFFRPKNTHPTESAWYCQSLPLFSILTRHRSGSVLPPSCRTAVQYKHTPRVWSSSFFFDIEHSRSLRTVRKSNNVSQFPGRLQSRL
jgi:hypothetical protein